jgi:hypothetical protein
VRTVLCTGVLLTGCFYLDPVNRKPEIFGSVKCKVKSTERPCLETGSVHRGDLLVLDVDFRDPEHREATASFDWKAYQCTDSGATVCDADPFRTEQSRVFELEVSRTLMGVRAIKVEHELRDELGAADTARDAYPINDPPTLVVRKDARAFVVGGPVELYATVSDVDEGPDRLAVIWDVVAPAPSAVPLDELAVMPDFEKPGERTTGKLLVPDRTGEWDVRIRATDTLPESPETTERHLTFPVGPDEPPCLAQSQPQVPPDGASLPVADPTLFQVAVVVDDLDPYPPLPLEDDAGPSFTWSRLAPGDPSREILTGATGNSVDFDPSAFTPGEIVELRVEIHDRKNTPIPCPDGVASCAISRPGCIQRQTWRVEVR